MPGYEFEASRFWISSSDAPSGGKGTKKWPSIRSLNGGGDMYDATASTGRWKGGGRARRQAGRHGRRGRGEGRRRQDGALLPGGEGQEPMLAQVLARALG